MRLVLLSLLLIGDPKRADSEKQLRQYPLDIVPVSPLNCTGVTSINFQAGTVYLIESFANGEVIDLKDSITQTRNPVITYPRHGGANQRWIAKASQGANSFNLVTTIQGSILRALTYNAWESQTTLNFLHDGLSQRWYIGKQCRQFVQIRSNVRNSNSGNACLTRTSTGNPMRVVKCEDSNENQLWKLKGI